METLKLETLPQVRDGALTHLFNEEMRKVYQDCDDRPHVKTARTITLKITVTPDGLATTSAVNSLEGVDVGFSVSSSVPAQSFSRRMKASAKRKGIVFEADTDSTAPADGQKTIDKK